jgi:GNAT superfamily N-acetyltransferase
MAEFVRAVAKDRETLVGLMRVFYEGERLALGAEQFAAVDALLANGEVGENYLIRDGEVVVGYFVLTFGYSVERGGKTGLVDEFFVREEARGRGVGREAIEFAVEVARDRECAAVQLEVDRGKGRLMGFYARMGFAQQGRDFLTRLL